MKTKVISLIKEWALHFASLVFLFNFFDSIDYLGKISRFGEFGSAETVWQRIIRHTFQNPEILEMAAFTMLVEALYHFVFKKCSWPVFIAWSLFGCAVVLVAHATLRDKDLMGVWQPLIVLMGYVVGYALLREFFHHKLYKLNVRLGSSENELQLLKQQLDPHFLFNTLNYLYGTALREKAESTAEGIEVMSGMMRYSLEGMQETFVPLAAEINFIEQYLYLQRVRMPEKSAKGVKTSINVTNGQYLVAPMLLIPFIENAFKYGVSSEAPVDINLNITSNGDTLTMQLANAMHSQSLIKGTNNGLQITRRRLELLYPDKHKLNITTNADTYSVLLTLTLQAVNK